MGIEDHKTQRNQGGRKPKTNPRKYRYVFRLDANDNETFLKMYVRSGMNNKAKFIVARIFEKEMKMVVIDRYSREYHQKLTSMYAQFRAIGVNYNQVVKLMHGKMDEKNASSYLFLLEKLTTDLAEICKKIVNLTKDFERSGEKK